MALLPSSSRELGYKVTTIELSVDLHARAREVLEPLGVTCLNGDSGVMLKQALASVPPQSNVFLWLDGHYSAGETAKGGSDTPIARELFAVENYLRNTDAEILVKVDDIRGFGSGDYPSLDKLVDFANRNFLRWTIELDSFICSNRPEFSPAQDFQKQGQRQQRPMSSARVRLRLLPGQLLDLMKIRVVDVHRAFGGDR